jgi:hypothetical protein
MPDFMEKIAHSWSAFFIKKVVLSKIIVIAFNINPVFCTEE